MPRPRPPGNLNAIEAVPEATEAAVTGSAAVPEAPRPNLPTAAPMQSGRIPHVIGRADPEGPSTRAAPVAPVALVRTLVMVVRPEIEGPTDLTGRRLAVTPGPDDSGQIREILERAGVTATNVVPLEWVQGLLGMARGEVDGVVIGVGPGLSPDEVRNLAMGTYKVLQVSLGSTGR